MVDCIRGIKELKHLYHPSAKELAVVEVPALDFVVADGQGGPQYFSRIYGGLKHCNPAAYPTVITFAGSAKDTATLSILTG